MSPFRSQAQMKAAFAGYLGTKMKSRAKLWASETPNIKKLPKHTSSAQRAKNKMSQVMRDMARNEKLQKIINEK